MLRHRSLPVALMSVAVFVWVVGIGRPMSSIAAASCTTSFSIVPSPKPTVLLDNRFTAIDPRTATDVWAVGSDRHSRPLVERFDGSAWTVVDTPQVADAETVLYGVAAVSSSDVWVVGQEGFGSAIIMHWDGSGWTFSPTYKHGGALAIDARSASDIWAVGDAFTNAHPTHVPAVWHYDGTSWTQSGGAPSVTEGTLRGVVAVSSTDVWAVGSSATGALIEHWNGTTWKTLPDPSGIATASLQAASASSAADVLAVGSTGESPLRTVVERWDGSAWSVVSSPTLPLPSSLAAVTSVSADDAWLVGSSVSHHRAKPLVEHWDGSALTQIATGLPRRSALLGVRSGPGGLWTVGAAPEAFSGVDRPLTARLDGTSWTTFTAPSVDGAGSPGMAVASGVAGPLVEHWDGGSWSVVPTPNVTDRTFRALAAIASDDVWVVGSQDSPSGSGRVPLTEHWDGTTWTAIPSNSHRPAFTAISATSSNDVWALAGSEDQFGRIAMEHWDGAAWSTVPGPSTLQTDAITGLAAASPSNVWIVGYSVSGTPVRPIVEHWNGVTWKTVAGLAPGDGVELFGVRVLSGDVWAFGDEYPGGDAPAQPFAERRSGGSWFADPTPPIPVTASFTGLDSVSATDVVAVGYDSSGALLAERWDGTGWSEIGTPQGSGIGWLVTVAALPDGDAWAVGVGSGSTIVRACGL